MDNIFTYKVVGNELWRILFLFCITFVSFLLGKIGKFFLKKWAIKFENFNREIIAAAINSTAQSIVFLLLAFGISIGLNALQIPEKIQDVVQTVSRVIVTLSIGYFIYLLVDVPMVWLSKISDKTDSKLDEILLPVIRKSLRITVVILVLVQVAQILSDKPITSVIAGLGIGGLAVALAAQDSIKNFFGSIVLSVDKPFVIGDRIVVDGYDGPVEEVGLRSTKVRTLDGHLVTIPNGELANKTIQNIGKRPYIRRLLNLTITYDTPPEKIDRALDIVKGLLDNHEGLNAEFPPRVFFNDYNSDSLNLLVIYWYHPPNYWEYLEFTEKFNKEVFRRFKEEGIDFAFPTQTVYLAGDPSRPLNVGVQKEDSSA